jgi:hypothetical protein
MHRGFNSSYAVGRRIRRVDHSMSVSTVSGNGTASSANGNAITARFNNPTSVTLDNTDNLITFGQENHVVSEVKSHVMHGRIMQPLFSTKLQHENT